MRKVFTTANPFAPHDASRSIYERGRWPCRWIGLADLTPSLPIVAAYRLQFVLEHKTRLLAHVTADERYILFVDGREVARGPERGTPDHWFYESFEFELDPGEHLIVAQVWSVGAHAPRSQMSLGHGFLFAPQEAEHWELVGTGCAVWECKILPGYCFERPFSHDFYSRGSNVTLDGRQFPWGFEKGGGGGWGIARPLHPGASAGLANRYGSIHLLTPSTLPEMRCQRFAATVRFAGVGPLVAPAHLEKEASAWNDWVAGNAGITVGPESKRLLLLDFEEYRCGFSRVRFSGGRGAHIALHWAESLFQEPEARTKGNRDEIFGKFFVGVGDTIVADGGGNREWSGLWLQSGRYLRIEIETAGEALNLVALELIESRYPLDMESEFSSSDPRLDSVACLALRSLQACCHDAYIDGPYYEQMMWVGDSRLKALVNYATSTDDRLARKALTLFDRSRLPNGLTRARWPARDTMIIAPYSLWWVGMVYDYALWRGDRDFIRSLMPGARAVIDGFSENETVDGLVVSPAGWNFMDWVPGWSSGVPPGGDGGVSALLNWQLVLALQYAAALEDWLGEGLLGQRWKDKAAQLGSRLHAAFWVEKRGLFSDDLEHNRFSEHTQALAVLSGALDPAAGEQVMRNLLAPDVVRCTIYFSHYLLEAYAKLGLGRELLARIEPWFGYEKLGLRTLPESPEPTRSDCHGWGAHVLYHFFASLLGIRPDGFGFERVRIAPLACGLKSISGSLVHPLGLIRVEVAWADGKLKDYTIQLPTGLEAQTS